MTRIVRLGSNFENHTWRGQYHSVTKLRSVHLVAMSVHKQPAITDPPGIHHFPNSSLIFELMLLRLSMDREPGSADSYLPLRIMLPVKVDPEHVPSRIPRLVFDCIRTSNLPLRDTHPTISPHNESALSHIVFSSVEERLTCDE